MSPPRAVALRSTDDPSHAATQPSWLQTLEHFGVPCLCYAADGRRVRTSPAAGALLEAAGAGAVVLAQADELARSTLQARSAVVAIGHGARVAERPCAIAGTVLVVYLPACRAGEPVRAVVVLHPAPERASDSDPHPALTRREHEVARLIAAGLTTKEIAGRLGRSVHTVRHHGEHVFRKLGVRTRSAVAATLWRG